MYILELMANYSSFTVPLADEDISVFKIDEALYIDENPICFIIPFVLSDFINISLNYLSISIHIFLYFVRVIAFLKVIYYVFIIFSETFILNMYYYI